MTTMSTTAAATKLRNLLAAADDAKLITSLEILIAMNDKGSAERYTSACIVDELAARFSTVNEALAAWEHDLETEESSAELAVRVTRESLGL